MKNLFRYIFYASVLFLLIALIRADYLVIPDIHHPGLLITSLLLLFAGFLFNGVAWGTMVRQANYAIPVHDSIVSLGMSIFAKYIPGKVWILMGRAEFLAKKYQVSRKNMGSLSLDAQLVALWVALLLGTVGMIAIDSINVYGVSVLLLFLILNLMLFTPFFHAVLGKVFSRVLKREIIFPRLPFRRLLQVMLWYLLNWGLWCISFYLLAGSLVQEHLPFSISFAFALAGSIGILVLFAPGGLGVREGVLTGFLIMAGLELPVATTIAVASRLWFLTGELFIFSLAAAMKSGIGRRR